jgi:hypothetical protein
MACTAMNRWSNIPSRSSSSTGLKPYSDTQASTSAGWGEVFMQFFSIGDEILRPRRQERCLAGMVRLPPTRARVGCPQQGDAQATSCAAITSPPSSLGFLSGSAMYVMKFADGGDAAQKHHRKGHARGMVETLGREPIGGEIHAFAPGPERIVLGSAAMLGAAAQDALEGVRMAVDQSQQWPCRADVGRPRDRLGRRKTG